MTREAGFTLVEVLVALALFAGLALAATMLTASATRAVVTADTSLSAVEGVERTRALLAADLGQAAQRPSLTADGALLPAFTLTPHGFVLVRRGLSGVLPSVEKVAWGFDGSQWLRQSFPTIDGSVPGAPVVLLAGVSGVRLRVMTESGWQTQWQPPRPEALPRAVELLLERPDGRHLLLILPVAA